MDHEQFEYLTKIYPYFYESTEIDIIILRGHLLLEEKLDDIIAEFVFHKEFIIEARLSFEKKLKIAQSMSMHESKNSMWKLVASINSLRNQIVHGLPSKKSQDKLENVKKLFILEAQDTSYNDVWVQGNHEKSLKYSILLCIGFLSAAKQASINFQKIMQCMAWEINSINREN